MSEPVQFPSMAVEDTVERLRVHGRLFTAYALALAQRAGFGPGEAADLFLQPLLTGAPSPDDVGEPGALQRWLETEAAAMEAVHGPLRLEQEGDAWTMVIAVAEDLAWLRRWGVSAAYWVSWLEGHVGRVAARHGASTTANLEDNMLYLRFREERT